jgi:hypothetical protein
MEHVRLCAWAGIRKNGIRGVRAGVTHLELKGSHLCCAAIADNDAVGTEWIVAKDVFPECLAGTVRVRTLFLGE